MDIQQALLAEDLLEGAEAIAEFMYGDKTKRRRVYHLAEAKSIPCFRLGGVLCARKSTLRRHIEQAACARLVACAA